MSFLSGCRLEGQMRHKCPAFERARNRATSALETAKAARAWAWATTVSPCNSLQIAEDYPYSALEIYSFDSNGNCPDAQFVSIALKARFKEQFRSCRVGPVHREEIVQSEYYFHPELGYACPAPRLRREVRVACWSLVCGAVIGAAAVIALSHSERGPDAASGFLAPPNSR
jgi:hypothetical protein